MLNRNIRSGGYPIPRSTIDSVIEQAWRLCTFGCTNVMPSVMTRHGLSALRVWDDEKSHTRLCSELPLPYVAELNGWITHEQDLFDREVARFTQVGEHS